MKNKKLFLFLGLGFSVLIFLAFYKLLTQPDSSKVNESNYLISGSVYENEYLKIKIPSGWKLTQEKDGSKITLSKDNYILSINVRAQQASGVKGGRFSEIAQGFPSVDAVVKIHPMEPCGFQKEGDVLNIKPIFNNLKRIDVFTNKNFKNEFCNAPDNDSTVWYFSYFTKEAGNYFNYYSDYGVNLKSKADSPFSFVILVSYNSDNVNKLPIESDPQLKLKLQEITNLVKTLEIKFQQ